MAISYTPRDELARLLRERRMATPSGGMSLPPRPAGVTETGVRLGRTAADMGLRYPQLKDFINKTAAGKAPSDPGIVGALVNNPFAKVALAGVEAFALTGRATMAGIREVVDAIDGNDDTRFSGSDFVRNVKDREYGFGKAFKVNTGNKWVDRIIGFVGDVALDPLTYATFGAGKFVTQGGRLDLAAKVLRQTGDERLATAIVREGRSALRNLPNAAEVLESVGANKYGVYFFGKRIRPGRPIRLPMSGHIGEIGERALTKIRLGITDSRIYDKAGRMLTPKSTMTAVRALNRPGINPKTGAQLVRFLEATPVQRTARAAKLQALEQEVSALFRQLEDEGLLDSSRGSVYRLLENPELLDGATAAEREVYTRVKDFFDRVKTEVDAGFKEVDEFANVGFVQNYFPRALSEEGVAFVRGSASQDAQNLRRVFLDDPFDLPDSFQPRALRPGKEFFGTVLKESDMNVERLNQIARDAGFEGNFFDTDLVNAITRYAQDTADEFGLIARNKHLKDNGFFTQLDDAALEKMSVNEDAVKFARDAAEESVNAVKAAEQAMIDAGQNVRKVLDTELAAITSGAKVLDDVAEEIVNGITAARGAVLSTMDSVNQAMTRMMKLLGDFDSIEAAILSESFPATMLPMLGQYQSIQAELAQYASKLDSAVGELFGDGANVLSSGWDVAALEGARDRLAAEAAEISKRISESAESIARSMERSNALAENWDNITSGGNVIGDSSTANWLRSIKELLGTGRAANAKVTALTEQRRVLGVGGWKNWIKTTRAKQAFASFAGDGSTALKYDRVSRISQASFERRMQSSLTEAVSVRELRELAAYAMLRDTHLWGDDIPQEVRRFWDELDGAMRAAEDAEAMAAIRSDRVSRTSFDVFESRWNQSHDAALAVQGDLAEKNLLVTVIERLTANTPDLLGREFTEANARVITSAVNELAKEAGIPASRARVMPFLADLLDNADDLAAQSGRTVPTIEDVLGASRTYASALEAEMDEPLYVLGQGKLRRGDSAPMELRLSARQVIEQYPIEAAKAGGGTAAARQATGNVGSVTYAGRQRTVGQATKTVEDAKFELAAALSKYDAISEATTNFAAVSMLIAQDGLVPTEEMWRGILKAITQKHRPRYEAGYRRSMRAEEVLRNFQKSFYEELRSVEARNRSVIQSVSAAQGATLSAEAMNAERKIVFDVLMDLRRNNRFAAGDAFFGTDLEKEVYDAVDEILKKNPVQGLNKSTSFREILRKNKVKIAKELGLDSPSEVTVMDIIETAASADGLDATSVVRLGKMTPEVMTLVAQGKETPAQVFSRVWKQMMVGEDADIVAQAIGPTMARMVDPGDLRRTLRDLDSSVANKVPGAKEQRAAFIDNVLYPWAKSIDPSIRAGSKDAAVRILKNRVASSARNVVRANANPFSIHASRYHINRWFDEIFDTAESGPILNVADAGNRGVVSVRRRGILAKQQERFREMENFFSSFDDPFVDPSDIFLKGGSSADTPSWFGLQMQHLADELETVLGAESFNPKGVFREALKADQAAAKGSVRADKARAVVEAMEGAAETGTKLTKAQLAARDAILEHRNFMSTAWYSKAKMDADIVKFLRVVAGVDMSAFDNGFVVSQRRIPVYENPVIEEATKTASETRRELRALKKAHEEEVAAVFAKAQAGDIELDEVDRVLEPLRVRHAAEVKALEDQASAATREAKVATTVERSAAPTRWEEEPVYFTYKTPNGGTARLKFTQEEWDSLYARPASPKEVQAAETRRRSARQKMVPIERMVKNLSEDEIPSIRRRLDALIAAARRVNPDAVVEVDGVLTIRPRRGGVARKPVNPNVPSASASPRVKRGWVARQRGGNYAEVIKGKSKAEVDRINSALDSAFDELSSSVSAKYAADLKEWQDFSRGISGRRDMLAELANRHFANMRDLLYREAQLAQLKSQLQVLGDVYAEATRTVKILDGNVRNAALAKVRILVQGPEGVDGWFDSLLVNWSDIGKSPNATVKEAAKRLGFAVGDEELAIRSMVGKASKTDAEKRLEVLEEMWDANPSKRTLAEADRLAAEANSEAYLKGMASQRMHEKAAREAAESAVRSRRELGEMEKAVISIVDELRTAELSAARLAGAEFRPGEDIAGLFNPRQPGEAPFRPGDAMVERGVSPRLSEAARRLEGGVTYTFRGQTYRMPTLQEVLDNPGRVIRQLRERSDFFRDLRTGVKPVSLQAADVQTRQAVIAARMLELWESSFKEMGLRQSVDAARASQEAVEELGRLTGAWGQDIAILKRALTDFENVMNAERAMARNTLIGAEKQFISTVDEMVNRISAIAALYGDEVDSASVYRMLTTTGRATEPNAAEEVLMGVVREAQNRSRALKSMADSMREIIRNAPAVDVFKGSRQMDASARGNLLKVIGEFIEDSDNMLATAAQDLAKNEDGWALWSALTRAKLAEGRFLDEQMRLAGRQAALEQAQIPVVVQKIIKPYQKGYRKAAEEYLKANNLVQAKALRLPSYGVDAGAMDILTSMQRLNDGAVVRDFARFISGYTGFFKAYATLTPGFHVRNAISNAFQMFAGGAEARNMAKGLRTYRSFVEATKNITKFDEWDAAIERWLLTIPEADREAARIGYSVSVALQGGNVSEAFREITKMKKSILTDNIATSLSRKTGHKVEGSARFIMAFDAAKRGMSYNEAFTHTRRFLFDYHDPTILDETIRNIVPFWTWMSRNLPLQITNQWLNPKPYVLYDKFSKNFRAENDEDMPEWIRRQNPLALGGGFVITPDIPTNNIQKQVGDLLSPGNWLEYTNPALRVPIELMAGRQAFSGQSIEGYAPVSGALKAFLPLLEALGQVERDSQGRPVISQQAKYAIESMIPTVGQAGRLFPSMEQPGNRQTATTARYFGLPLRSWGPQEQENEQNARLRALQELLRKQKQIEEAGQ